jgi:hypothetical protein
MLPLAPLLPYVGLITAVLTAFDWLRDFRSDVRTIRTNDLPHLHSELEAQTHELRELRADMRTYFAKDGSGGINVTVSPVNNNEQLNG